MNAHSGTLAMVGVAALTAVIVVALGKPMLEWYPVPLPGIAGRIVLAIAFTIAAVIAGLIAQSVYARMLVSRPDAAATTYLWIGLGVAAALTVGGVVVRIVLGRGPVVAWTLLNLAWGIGYGVWLPRLVG